MLFGGVWHVESFTRVGYPLGIFWVTQRHTHWVTRWVPSGFVFRPICASRIDTLAGLCDLCIGASIAAKAVVTNGEEPLRNLAYSRFVSG
jgi:hypothetical protein